jgi:ribosomal-protein-alanine N-acetyltransferase
MELFNFGPFPILETQRLRLREIVSRDARAIFAIRSDYEVTRLNTGAPYTDMFQAYDLIEGMSRCYREKTELRWGITLKPDDTVIGMIGYNYWNRQDCRASVGFDLLRTYWRKGIMTEALRAVIVFGFEQMRLNRIEADCSAENAGSAGLLQKVGFKHEGTQREQYRENGIYYDLLLFGLLRHEWAADAAGRRV